MISDFRRLIYDFFLPIPEALEGRLDWRFGFLISASVPTGLNSKKHKTVNLFQARTLFEL
jgi:hypothetical protein